MEESGLVCCDSLDTASLSDRDMVEHMIFSSDQDVAARPEPTPAELAQCEAEVGTLLSIIAELNKKMGSLKAPSEPGDMRPSAPSRPLVPDLLSHRLKNTERKAMESRDQSKPPLMDRVCPPGGSGVVWTRLQDVLLSVEDSISFRRSWAAPITAVDVNKHKEHLRAAHESSVKASQILEEMEREFGISCTNVQSKDHFQEEIPDPSLSSLQNPQFELERAHSISLMEEEKDKLVGLQKAWRSGRRSPSYRSSGMSSAGSMSPDWASPPYPGSPLVHRRTSRGIPPLSGDMSPLGTGNSNSPCTSPIGTEGETERLSRCMERLKARNERLSVALERKKSESEHMSLTLNKLESDCSVLHTALRYSEECEEAYAELLSLYETKTHQSIQQIIPGTTGAAGGEMPCFTMGHPHICTGGMPVTDTNVYPDFSGTSEVAGVRPNSLISNMDTEELSTSFSTAAGTEEIEVQRPPDPDREVILRQQIERLKKERSSMCLPKPGPILAECKLIPDTAAGSQAGHRPDTKKEKASLFYELISVRVRVTQC